jgi:hypothetical protein
MEWNLQQIFDTPPIMGVTINTVFLHPIARTFLYVFMALALVTATVALLIRKKRFPEALIKASIISFFVSGIVYAAYADIGWSSWLKEDYHAFSGLGTEEKLLRMEGGFYDFIRKARTVLPDTYQIYSTEGAFPWRAEYFLLPKRKKAHAEFIVVIADARSRYDPVKHQLVRDDEKIENVDLALPYAQNAYILRRRK